MTTVLHFLGPLALVVLIFAGFIVGSVLVAITFTAASIGLYKLRVRLFGPPKRRPGVPEAVTATRRAYARIKRMAAPTLLLTPTKVTGFSKLGGCPELPEGAAWPEGKKEPRAFLAQLDLAEVRANGGPDWLPETGRLYAFYDEWRNGFADNVVVSHSTAAPGLPAPPPSKLEAKWRFPERRAGFLSATSFPSTDWLGLDIGELDEAEMETWGDIHDRPFGDELEHRVGGYPSEIQGGQMALECEYVSRGMPMNYDEPPDAIKRASRSWRLLLQIDSDPALKMNWGDGGRLYVFIREQHARKGDFSKTVTLSESY